MSRERERGNGVVHRPEEPLSGGAPDPGEWHHPLHPPITGSDRYDGTERHGAEDGL
ncbi:hypothetical protein FHX37_3070 [Haloactinospora alba]|uniref:Uncharacterized protein n=1 Tax=Haloactinospora alba TaxID=405555 RepID=A0A543NMK9_9ACTN|nr:hypothetical protein [Haloactinospora alba]TQN33072.1 hypothetical protein FHX37_3070 [Haloactinospora alba]